MGSDLRVRSPVRSPVRSTLARTVGIFPEGGSHDRPSLLPFRAGVAIMALSSLAKHPSIPLRLVPVGINYFSGHRFRSRVVRATLACMRVHTCALRLCACTRAPSCMSPPLWPRGHAHARRPTDRHVHCGTLLGMFTLGHVHTRASCSHSGMFTPSGMFHDAQFVDIGDPIVVPAHMVALYNSGGEEKRSATNQLMELVNAAASSLTVSAPDYETLEFFWTLRRIAKSASKSQHGPMPLHSQARRRARNPIDDVLNSPPRRLPPVDVLSRAASRRCRSHGASRLGMSA